jgi:hypothetical protein
MPRTPKSKGAFPPGTSLGIGDAEATPLAPTKSQRGGNRRQKRCTVRKTLKLSERHDHMLQQLAAWLDLPAAEVLKRALLKLHTDLAPHHVAKPANTQGATNADARHDKAHTTQGARTTTQVEGDTTTGAQAQPKDEHHEHGKRPRTSPGRASPEAPLGEAKPAAGCVSRPTQAQPQPFPARAATTAPSFGHGRTDTKQAAPENTGVSTGPALALAGGA